MKHFTHCKVIVIRLRAFTSFPSLNLSKIRTVWIFGVFSLAKPIRWAWSSEWHFVGLVVFSKTRDGNVMPGFVDGCCVARFLYENCYRFSNCRGKYLSPISQWGKRHTYCLMRLDFKRLSRIHFVGAPYKISVLNGVYLTLLTE